MATPYIGEIKIFAGDFAPRGWARCDGQLLLISDNEALFSLLQTNYGGDGMTTFALPDLRGRVPVHFGSGPGLTPRPIGSRGGAETVALNSAEMPSHSHPLQASTKPATDTAPSGNVLADTGADVYLDETPAVDMAGDGVTSVGGGGAHENVAPFQCINFIIALVGIFPSEF